jgi:hypothetical protein
VFDEETKGGLVIMRAFFSIGIASALVTIALGAQAAKPAHKAAAKTASQPAATAAKPATATPATATPATATPATATPAAPAASAPATAQPTPPNGAATASASTSAGWSSSADLPPAAPTETAFGDAHQLIVGVERAFGLYFWSKKAGLEVGGSSKESGTAINLLAGSDNNVPGTFATPRLAFDFTVVRNVTVGASFGYTHRSSSSQSTDAAGTEYPSTTAPGQSSLAFGLRGGYTLGLTKMLTFWPRLGFTYYTGDVGGGASINGLLINVEPTLVVSPVNHLGFTVSAIGDLPLSGKIKQPSGSFDNTMMNFGLAIGMIGYF